MKGSIVIMNSLPHAAEDWSTYAVLYSVLSLGQCFVFSVSSSTLDTNLIKSLRVFTFNNPVSPTAH